MKRRVISFVETGESPVEVSAREFVAFLGVGLTPLLVWNGKVWKHAPERDSEMEVEEPVPEWIVKGAERWWNDNKMSINELSGCIHRAYLAARERGEA